MADAVAAERVAIDQEARALVQDLHLVQTTMKTGSLEREQREDYIYKRLYQIADAIEARHRHDPRLRPIYYAITQQGTAVEPPSVSRLPVYDDEFKMFTQSPTTPKVHLFLTRMATDLQALPPATTAALLSDPTKDGPKQVVRALVSRGQREPWLQASAHRTCRGCWTEVMRHLFMMAVEMLTLELKQRAHQIRVMTERGYLTEVDALELVSYVEHIIQETGHLLKQSERTPQSKKSWIALTEALFRLLVGLINDLMMRYMQFVKFRQEVPAAAAAAAAHGRSVA